MLLTKGTTQDAKFELVKFQFHPSFAIPLFKFTTEHNISVADLLTESNPLICKLACCGDTLRSVVQLFISRPELQLLYTSFANAMKLIPVQATSLKEFIPQAIHQWSQESYPSLRLWYETSVALTLLANNNDSCSALSDALLKNVPATSTATVLPILDKGTELLGELMVELWKHTPELKNLLMESFSHLIQKKDGAALETMIEAELPMHPSWMGSFYSISRIIGEAAKYEASSTCESLVRELSGYINAMMKIVPHDLKQLYYLQQRTITCLLLMRQVVSCSKSIPFQVLETLRTLLDHHIAQVPMISSNFSAFSLHETVHALMCQIHREPKLHNQMNVFFEKQQKQQVKVSPNWKILEDFIGTCSTCGAKHGHVTPASFGAETMKRSSLLYEQTAQQDVLNFERDGSKSPTPPTTPQERKRKRSPSPSSNGVPDAKRQRL